MATIIKRGDAHRVQWPAPLPGRPDHKDGETLYTEDDAAQFRNLVEMPARRGDNRPLAQGKQHRPPVEVLQAYPWDSDKYSWLVGVPESGEPVADVVTVEEAMRRYIEWRCGSRLRLQPITKKTQDGYISVFRNYIQNSLIANEPVDTVNYRLIDAWTSEQLDRPKRKRGDGEISVRSVKAALTQLSQMFDWACSADSDPDPRGETPLRELASPMKSAYRPTAGEDPRKDKLVLRNAREYEIFFQCAYRVDPYWADMLVATAVSAMRFGEITAMFARQVDEFPDDWPEDAPGAGRLITIDQRYSDAQVLDPRTGKAHWTRVILPGTKSSRGERIVTREVRIPDGAWCAIEPHLLGKKSLDHVFTGPEFGRNGAWTGSSDKSRWVRPKNIKKAGKRRYMNLELANTPLGRRLGDDFRHHRLRHSLITYLGTEADGLPAIPESHIQAMVGHKSSHVTRSVYTHLTPQQWIPILARLEKIVAPVAEIRELAYKQHLADREANMTE